MFAVRPVQALSQSMDASPLATASPVVAAGDELKG
jgi:hypothetical protein